MKRYYLFIFPLLFISAVGCKKGGANSFSDSEPSYILLSLTNNPLFSKLYLSSTPPGMEEKFMKFLAKSSFSIASKCRNYPKKQKLYIKGTLYLHVKKKKSSAFSCELELDSNNSELLSCARQFFKCFSTKNEKSVVLKFQMVGN